MTESDDIAGESHQAVNWPAGAPASPETPASPDVEERLRCQVAKWQSKLLDLGNRNPLINCSFNASRGVVELLMPDTDAVWKRLATEGTAGSNPMRFPWRRDLVPPPPGYEEEVPPGSGTDSPEKKRREWNPPLEQCRASRKFGERDLLTPLGDRALDRRLRTLDGHAHLSLSEQGVHCLYVAFGFLKWYESVDSDVEHLSPLMLTPMSLSRASADAPWELTEAEDDAIDNLCLRERLKQDFGMSLPPLPDIGELEEDGARLRFLDAVRNAIAANERWEVQDRCALGRFAFPKIAMWQDLGEHVDSVLVNALCRSIGGDETVPPQRSFGFSSPLPEAARLDDEVVPGEIKTILDCDSSQLEAILAARRGVSFVLDGPPGTGKSQTIANIIADALSEGRRVLFVSEKVSALEVVKRRLDDCGLGDFCLECHSSKANRKAVLEELQYCLDLPAEVYDDVTPRLEEARQKRTVLNDYVRAIHSRRPPLGLSPYELYGHVSRFHRLGHAVKSRCELPAIDDMDRVRFEGWLDLLDRAKDSADVIQSHRRHAWRGCQLTTRTLTLSDELQHHLGILATAFRAIHEAVSPLVEQGLLAEEPTPATLDGVFQSFRNVLEVPQVPADWFSAPREISTAILRRCRAVQALQQHREGLPEFVEDVEARFPERGEFSTTEEQRAWFERLEGALPETVRGQEEFLREPVSSLQEFIGSIDRVTTATATVTALFPVPLRADLLPYKLPAVVDLANLVASVLPLRPEGLLSENWPRLRSSSQTALSHLEEATRIVQRLEGRVSADQIVGLSQSLDTPDRFDAAWDVVKEVDSEGHLEELVHLQERLEAGRSALGELQSTVQGVCGAWEIEGTIAATLSLVRSLEKAIPLSFEAGVLQGLWRDANVRGKMRAACEAAISDLQEAAEVRSRLEVRMSHRAFKGTSIPLVERAPAYQSVWKRWFGGFGAYRQEVAELFKGGCPSTKVLLADLLQLRVWHRRMAEVAETAHGVADGLPPSFPVDDVTAWARLRESLRSFEQFADAVPDLAGRLPARAITANSADLKGALSRLGTLLQQIRSSFSGTGFERLLDDRTLLSEVSERLTQFMASLACCRSAHQAAAGFYLVAPRTLKTLVEDRQFARRYATLQEEVRRQSRLVADMRPSDAVATDPSSWQRVERSVLAAERLSKLVSSLEKHQDALCRSGHTDPSALSTAASRLEADYRSFLSGLRAVASHLSLLEARHSVEDLLRWPLAELRNAAQSAVSALSARQRMLASLLPALQPEGDVSVDSLSEVQAAVESIRSWVAERDDGLAILREWNVDADPALEEGGQAEATWLLEQAAAGSIGPLTKEVASSPSTRQNVSGILEVCRDSLRGDVPAALKFLRTVFSFRAETGHGLAISQMPMGVLGRFLQGLCSAQGSLDEWLKFSRWRRDMEEQGFGGVVEELLAGRYPAEETKNVIAARFFRLVFDRFASEDRLLGEFDLEAHEQSRERFRKLDEWEVRAASSRIRQYQLGRDDRPRSGWFAEATSELGILQKEIQKKRRQLPLRKLFAEIPSVLQRLKPCIMMSPLSVSTFLQSDELRFDLVIFDEASQVFPWDAIGAIYRGNQLIVAGDEKQLPPTNFFNRADIESAEEEDTDIGDFESILSLCKSIGMPGRGLRWHYRSRREPLIAFSNRHFYSGDLVTFPSVRDASSDAVRLEFVPQGRWIERKNEPEAERVTDLVIRHLRARPETSLGIIAFNQSQQTAIEDAIHERRRKYPELETMFHAGLSEPLFVKNLENVQGDERDVIILSIGYGYNEAGKFLKNFGPLTKSGGERRLNVAVTRAREEVILVASVKAADLDLSGSTSLGAHLLKGYLEYAERGVDSLARMIDSITGEAESTFEQEVAAALVARGLHPVAQVGCGGFRIDLALKHSERPGEFCLGIECDGATYHSSKTARDRDRIRQNVLEHLGWNIVRIWSTDWIRNPDRQIERVLDAYERTCRPRTVSPGDLEEAVEDDLEDLKPRFEQREDSTGPLFKSIKEVPEEHLRNTFRTIIRRGGAIDLEGLVQQTSRALGFARTGKQIRMRLEGTLNDLLQVGHLRWIGDRIASGVSE